MKEGRFPSSAEWRGNDYGGKGTLDKGEQTQGNQVKSEWNRGREGGRKRDFFFFNKSGAEQSDWHLHSSGLRNANYCSESAAAARVHQEQLGGQPH